MYAIFDDKGYMSLTFDSLEEAEKSVGEWKDNYLGEGVDFDSYVSIVKFIDVDEDDFVEVKRWNIVVDEEMHKEIGSPEDNGCDFVFWAKWEESVI